MSYPPRRPWASALPVAIPRGTRRVLSVDASPRVRGVPDEERGEVAEAPRTQEVSGLLPWGAEGPEGSLGETTGKDVSGVHLIPTPADGVGRRLGMVEPPVVGCEVSMA